MMKTLVAFVGGALVAATIAVVALRKDTPPEPVQTAQTATPAQPIPAAEPPAAQPSAESAPVAAAPARERPAKAVKGIEPPTAAVNAPRQPATATYAPPPQTPAEPAPVPAAAPPPAPQAEVQQPEAPPKLPKPPSPPEPNTATIAAGVIIPVRLAETLSSERAQDGQVFQATLDQPIIVDGFVIAERGSRVEGRVLNSEQAGKVKGTSQLSLELTRITSSDGQRVPVSTGVWVKQGEQTRTQDAAKVAAGAGIGAALGAIFGGGKGAAIGAASGGAAGTGVVLTSRGKPVVLSTETRISFKLKAPVTITEKR